MKVLISLLVVAVLAGCDSSSTCATCPALASQSYTVREDGCWPYCEGEDPPNDPAVLGASMNGTWQGSTELWADGAVQWNGAAGLSVTSATAVIASVCPRNSVTATYVPTSATGASWSGTITCVIPAYGCEVGVLTVTSAWVAGYSEGSLAHRSYGRWSGCGKTVDAVLAFFGPQRTQ